MIEGKICCSETENGREITLPEDLRVDSDVGRGGLLICRKASFANDKERQANRWLFLLG